MPASSLQLTPKSALLTRTAAFLLLALPAGAAYWVASSLRQAEVTNLGIEVDESSLVFADTWEDKAFCWSIPLRNPTSKPIEILGFATSCSCLSVEPKTTIIPPHGTRSLKLTLDLTSNAGYRDAGASQREFSATIIPHFRENAFNPRGWKVGGRVRKVLSLASGRQVLLGELVRGQQWPTSSIRLLVHAPLSAITASCDPSMAARVAIALPPPGEDHVLLHIEPLSQMPTGTIQLKIDIRPVHQNGVQLPAVTVPVVAIVKDDIMAVPCKVIFGAREIGLLLHETVTLSSYANKSFEVEAFTADSKDIVLEPMKKDHSPSHSTKTFILSQRIAQPGEQRHKVTFALRDHRGRPQAVHLDIVYYGVRAPSLLPLNASSSS